MNELDMILEELPDADEERIRFGTIPGSGYFKIPPANAWVAVSVKDGVKYLEIYPEGGGYIEVMVACCGGDLAPFCD